MNILKLVYRYLSDKMLTTVLNIVLLSLGIAVVFVLISFNRQLGEKITANARGIDLVVGAKGSPLQLILCSIFHVDFPTGNIRLRDAERIARMPLVKKAIPMALGDSFEGYRIVGTTRQYAELYAAQMADGDWYSASMQAVVGANVAERTGLQRGGGFVSSHGLSGAGDHHDAKFVVTGVLGRSGTVLDNLVLTQVESVWMVHESHESDSSAHHAGSIPTYPSRLVPSVDQSDTTKELTSMLIQFRNPLAAIQLPRFINTHTKMQAASPAFETARLFSILGVGASVMSAFSIVLVVISALSIFIVLYNAMRERQYDLAIMRTMGAGRGTVFSLVVLEGTVLTTVGTITGLLLGHLCLVVFVSFVPDAGQIGFSPFRMYREELFVLIASAGLGIGCSIIPAMQAYKLNIHRVLSGN